MLDPNRLAKMIRSWRTLKRMTQPDFAREFGISLTMLKEVESGRKKDPPMSFLAGIRASGMTADSVLDRMTGADAHARPGEGATDD